MMKNRFHLIVINLKELNNGVVITVQALLIQQRLIYSIAFQQLDFSLKTSNQPFHLLILYDMNLGVMGVYAGMCANEVAKKSVLLGTAVFLDGFSLAWLNYGHITGHPSPRSRLFTL
jgi:hypothetical protein